MKDITWECHDCGTELDNDNGWCDTCYMGVLLGDDLYG